MASTSSMPTEDLLSGDPLEDCHGKKFPSFKHYHAWFEERRVKHYWNCLVKKSQDDYFQAYCPTELKVHVKGTAHLVYSFVSVAGRTCCVPCFVYVPAI